MNVTSLLSQFRMLKFTASIDFKCLLPCNHFDDYAKKKNANCVYVIILGITNVRMNRPFFIDDI